MKQKFILITIAIAVVALGVYSLQRDGNKSQTQEEAIKQAQKFKPQGICTQALVPAVHAATGAKYTFSSGCLAPGWEPEQ